jgi:ligand-binding sensor domain-containing protein
LETKFVIFQYNPETNSINEITLPDTGLNPGSWYSGIRVDDKGRIWFGDVGWLDEKGIWNRYLTSPLFLTDRLKEAAEMYNFSHEGGNGSIIALTSDDSLWFNSMNGLIRSNAKEEKWCWVTTEMTNIVEDNAGNVWILVDNKLYKRQL